MKKLTVTNRKDIYELKYSPRKGQKVVEWAVLNLNSDKVKGFLPVTVTKKMSSVKITVPLNGYCSLDEYLPMVSLTAESFLRITEEIIRNISEGDEYNFRRHSILLDPAYVMINPSELSVKLICIPMEPFEKTGSLSELLLYLARKAVFSGNESPAFLREYKTIAESDEETACFLEMRNFINKLMHHGNENRSNKVNRCPVCSSIIAGGTRCPKCGNDIQDTKKQTASLKGVCLQHCPDGEMIPLNKLPFRIGHSEIATEYCVKNKYVSSIHAEIICDDSVYYIIDRESTNGTFINGKKIAPLTRIPLRNTDSIALGNESFIFRIN